MVDEASWLLAFDRGQQRLLSRFKAVFQKHIDEFVGTEPPLLRRSLNLSVLGLPVLVVFAMFDGANPSQQWYQLVGICEGRIAETAW